MDFGLSNEQEMIIDSVKNFVEQEYILMKMKLKKVIISMNL